MRNLQFAVLLVFTWMFWDANAQTRHYPIETFTNIDYIDLQDGFLITPDEAGLKCY